MARFCTELKNAGGYPHVAHKSENAWQVIKEVIAEHMVRKVVLGQGGLVEHMDLAGCLGLMGLEISTLGNMPSQSTRDVFFRADLGISNVEHLIAETGTVVMATKPEEPRSLTLLPPIHIALAHKNQLLPDLFDLFDLFSPVYGPAKQPPSCLTLITGPSKTGDIELRLVTGVHGPGVVHVVLCDW